MVSLEVDASRAHHEAVSFALAVDNLMAHAEAGLITFHFDTPTSQVEAAKSMASAIDASATRAGRGRPRRGALREGVWAFG